MLNIIRYIEDIKYITAGVYAENSQNMLYTHQIQEKQNVVKLLKYQSLKHKQTKL